MFSVFLFWLMSFACACFVLYVACVYVLFVLLLCKRVGCCFLVCLLFCHV